MGPPPSSMPLCLSARRVQCAEFVPAFGAGSEVGMVVRHRVVLGPVPEGSEAQVRWQGVVGGGRHRR